MAFLSCTPTLRGATALHLLRTRGPMTAGELAEALGCSLATAYRVLARLEWSTRYAVVCEGRRWGVRERGGLR